MLATPRYHSYNPVMRQPPDPSTVDLYLRKSNKDEGRSVDRQLRELTDAAEDEGLEIGKVFVDPHFSASRFRRLDRPDYARLIEHINSGDCRMIGVLEVTRGSRDLEEWAALLALCRRRQVRIWVATHERIYDVTRRRDWRALADEGVDAADESEKISERTTSGKRKAARDGRPAGRLTFGYTRRYDEAGRFVEQIPHPDQAPIVAEMVRRVADGEALAAIARDLNERGVTTPEGHAWAGRDVRQTVIRPTYAGRRVHQGQDFGPAMWEPIVDVDRWRTAVAALSDPRRRSGTRGTALSFWLSGVALCGRCGNGRLVMHSGGAKGRRRYGCLTDDGCGGLFVAAGPFEDCLETLLLSRLAQPDVLEWVRRRPAGDDAEAERAEAEVRRLRQRLDDHYAEAAAGRLSARGLTAVESRLLADIEVAEQRAQRLAVPRLAPAINPAQVLARWPVMSPPERRRVITTFAEVVVSPATRRGPGFDESRLYASRWVGDDRTWGELAECAE